MPGWQSTRSQLLRAASGVDSTEGASAGLLRRAPVRSKRGSELLSEEGDDRLFSGESVYAATEFRLGRFLNIQAAQPNLRTSLARE